MGQVGERNQRDLIETQVGRISAEDLIPDHSIDDVGADEFDHKQIAARVAELASVAKTPVNVALFGPWGSGKSSFCHLLSEELKSIDGSIPVVRYDAWKYGGTALQRNFISNAASELKLKDARFRTGLYESTKTVRFDPRKIVGDGQWKLYASSIALLAFATLIILLVLTSASSVISDAGWIDELRRLTVPATSTAAAALVTVVAALRVLDSARVNVDVVRPSDDEQFSGLFGLSAVGCGAV